MNEDIWQITKDDWQLSTRGDLKIIKNSEGKEVLSTWADINQLKLIIKEHNKSVEDYRIAEMRRLGIID